MAEFRVNTTTQGSQKSSAIAIADDGSYVIVWADYVTGGTSDLKMQRYDATGAAIGSEYTINSITAGYQYFPDISLTSGGNFIVTWSTDDENTGSPEVFARRFTALGEPTGVEFRVNTYTANAQTYSKVAASETGSFVVIWQSDGQDGNGSGIYGQRYDSNGIPNGSEFRVNVQTGAGHPTISGHHQSYPSVAMRDNGSFVVTWSSIVDPGSSDHNIHDIYARIYNADGTPSTGEFRVNSYTPNSQLISEVAIDASGNFVIAWTSGNLNANVVWIPDQDGTRASVYAQRYTANGTKIGSEFRVNTYTTDVQSFPSVAMAPTGEFIIAWQSKDQDGSAFGIYAQRYNADGTKYGGEFRVNDYVIGDQTAPKVAMNSLHDFVITWDSLAQDGDASGVYAERFFTGIEIVAASAAKAEGNAGTTAFTFTVARFGEIGDPAWVDYTVGGGTADASDFGGAFPSGQVIFAPGESTKTMTILVSGDLAVEESESFTVTLSNAINARITTAQAAGTIINDDLNLVSGTAGNDTLTGTVASDLIDGGAGNDVLRGMAGNDSLIGGDGVDTADYSLAVGPVTISLRAGEATGDGTDSLNGIENLIGSSFDDTLAGDAGANTLAGGGGVDTVTYAASLQAVIVNLYTGGNAGGDAEGDVLTGIRNLIGTSLADTLSGDNNGNRLEGAAGDDVLNGNGGADLLLGGDGNDTLSGGVGADLLDGGSGSDSASYAASTAAVAVSLVSGTGSGGHATGDVLTGVENIVGSNYADLLTGDTSANALSGGGGDDTLVGGAGADVITGGGGIDTASYAASSQGVTINLFTGVAEWGDAQGDALSGIENLIGSSFADLLSGDNAGNLLDGGSGDDVLNGNGGADSLLGGDGNDTLSGGAGADTLDGGAGDNTASYATATAGVVVSLTDGTATGGHAEGDVLTNIQNLIGSSYSDSLTGDAGVNTLLGGAGADSLIGAAGNDTASYATSIQGVTVNLFTGVNTGGDAEGDTLTGIENLIGSDAVDTLSGDNNGNRLDGGGGADILNGNGGADTLWGGDGNDTLTGGAGADMLDGGAGLNTASYASSTAAVTVSLAGPAAGGGHAEGDVLVNVQNLTGSSYADTLIGDAGDNTLIGGAGNDTLAGGAGADTLNGGGGIDTVLYDQSSQGISVNLYTGAAAGGDSDGDTLTGVENLVGSSFSDLLSGDTNGNRLEGGGGDDILNGNGGADILVGGIGLDTLTGGAGVDCFRFTDPAGGQDLVTDFLVGTDLVEVTSGMFGNLAPGPLDASRFATDTATTVEHRFVFATVSRTLYYDADGSGAGSAVALAVFSNATLTAASIVVV